MKIIVSCFETQTSYLRGRGLRWAGYIRSVHGWLHSWCLEMICILRLALRTWARSGYLPTALELVLAPCAVAMHCCLVVTIGRMTALMSCEVWMEMKINMHTCLLVCMSLQKCFHGSLTESAVFHVAEWVWPLHFHIECCTVHRHCIVQSLCNHCPIGSRLDNHYPI